MSSCSHIARFSASNSFPVFLFHRCVFGTILFMTVGARLFAFFLKAVITRIFVYQFPPGGHPDPGVLLASMGGGISEVDYCQFFPL